MTPLVTAAAVLGTWTAAAIPAGCLIGHRLRHLNQETTMPTQTPERPAAWAEVYPVMRQILDSVIKANRTARRPVVDVTGLVHLRRDLGQLDRGTYQACTRSPGGWSSHAAFRLVREVINVTHLGHPSAGAILRLAADLADQNSEAREALIRSKTTEN